MNEFDKEMASTIKSLIPKEILVNPSFNTSTMFERSELNEKYWLKRIHGELVKIVKLKYVPVDCIIFVYKTEMVYIFSRNKIRNEYESTNIYIKTNVRGIKAVVSSIDSMVLEELEF